MANEKRLIDANALIANLEKIAKDDKTNYFHLDEITQEIFDAPTVDAVEVVHARWVHCNGKSNLWYCSNCGEKILYNPTRRTYNIEKRPVYEVNKYCRCCGAKMDGGNENA